MINNLWIIWLKKYNKIDGISPNIIYSAVSSTRAFYISIKCKKKINVSGGYKDKNLKNLRIQEIHILFPIPQAFGASPLLFLIDFLRVFLVYPQIFPKILNKKFNIFMLC